MSGLNEKLSEFITESKVKFKTQKLKKTFISSVIDMVKNYKETNVAPTPSNQNGAVTQIRKDHKPVGYAMMTEGMSSKNDAAYERVNAARTIK